MDWSPLPTPPPSAPDAQEEQTCGAGGLWQTYYGEEASLYSIAEDSREDNVSVLSSGGALAAKDALQSSWFLGSFPPSSQDTPPTAAAAAASSRGAMMHSTTTSSLPSAMGVELSITEDGKSFDDHRDDDELFYYYHPGRRRLWKRIGGIGLCCLLFCGIAVGTTLVATRGRRNQRSSSSHVSQTSASAAAAAGDNTLENDEEQQQQFSALAENQVFNALSACPGSSSARLFDPSTYEGQVFTELVRQVSAGATSDPTTGSILLDEMHSSTSYLQERFALEVLFYSTMGSDGRWERHDGWMNGGDPCDDWMGVECAVPRSRTSTCAVTGLYLGTLLLLAILVVFVLLWISFAKCCWCECTHSHTYPLVLHRQQWIEWRITFGPVLFTLCATHGNGQQRHWWSGVDVLGTNVLVGIDSIRKQPVRNRSNYGCDIGGHPRGSGNRIHPVMSLLLMFDSNLLGCLYCTCQPSDRQPRLRLSCETVAKAPANY